MAHKKIRLAQRLSYLFCLFFFHLTAMLPLPLARALGLGLARLGYYAVPRLRKTGRANLDIAYGDALSDEEKERILRGCIQNLGLVAVEFSRVPKLTRPTSQIKIDVKGFEHVDSSRGGVLVGAHLGNWEWMLPAVVRLGLKPIVVVREFDDPRMNAFVDRVRGVSGVKTVPKDAAMGPLLRKIGEGGQGGVLADQCPRDNAVPVTFFGASSWATIGPALIAMRAKAPLYPVSMTRDAAGVYTIEFFPALQLDDTGDTVADLQSNTQRCQDALETMIRKHPEQWLWFHKRWKKRERLEREWAERMRQRSETPQQAETKPEEFS